MQSTVAGATGATTKRRLEDRGAFDKRLRFSVRQTESAYRYRDIVVKKQDGFTHILLSTKSSENNALSPEVRPRPHARPPLPARLPPRSPPPTPLLLLRGHERDPGRHGNGGVRRQQAGAAERRRQRLLLRPRLLLLHPASDGRQEEGERADVGQHQVRLPASVGARRRPAAPLTLCLLPSRAFVNTFIHFRKPVVAAVNGPALGLGAAILPLCDIVCANEKAWFQTPYTAYGQTPDACSSLTFPRIMGVASVSAPPAGLRLTLPPRLSPAPPSVPGERAAAEWQEADGSGGLLQGPGVAGALAGNLHAGSDAADQGAGCRGRGGQSPAEPPSPLALAAL